MRGLAVTLTGPTFAMGAAGSALAVAYVLVEMGPSAALALALAPVIAVGAVYVLISGQFLLYVAAVALPMSALPVFGAPIVGPLYLQDLIAGLALGAIVFAKFLAPGEVRPIPRTPVLGLPFALFAAAIVTATLRGHYEYGAAVFGQPLRLALYAAIVAGLAGMTVPRLYTLLNVLFYSVAVYATFLGIFALATGTTFSTQDVLSTGGTRLISIGASLFCAGALFLAMLNLRFELGSRWLHIAMGALALFGVVVGFGRAVYLAVAVVGLLFLITSSRLRRNVLGAVPLVLPFLAVLAIGISHGAPELVDSVSARVFSQPENDDNVRWRVEANRAVLEQVGEQPLVGVGFGRRAQFFLELDNATTGLPTVHRLEIGQDPHNGYVFLLAGGGVVLLGTFLLLLAAFTRDALRRYRMNDDPRARLIILWSCAFLFAFLVNAASGTTFSVPDGILMIWALLVLPAVVGPADPRVDEDVEVDQSALAADAGVRDDTRPAW